MPEQDSSKNGKSLLQLSARSVNFMILSVVIFGRIIFWRGCCFALPRQGAPTCPSMPPIVTPLFAYHQAVTIAGSDECTTASLCRCTRDVTTRLDNEWRRQRRRRNSLMTGAKALVVGATDWMHSYLVYRQAG